MWEIDTGKVANIEGFRNGGLLLTLVNYAGLTRDYFFMDDEIQARLTERCLDTSGNDFILTKYACMVDPVAKVFETLSLAKSESKHVYVGVFEFGGIKFIRCITSSFNIHQCILSNIFEHPSGSPMYEPLLQIADTLDKNPACVTEWNGKGLFFSAEGNFEGPFDTVEQYMQWKSVGEIVGECFPFFAEAPVSRRFVQRT